MGQRKLRIGLAFLFAAIFVAILLWPPLYLYIYRISSAGLTEQYLDDVRGTTSDYASFISLTSLNGIHEETRILDEFMLRNNVVYAELVVGDRVYKSSLPSVERYVFKEDIELGGYQDNVYFLSVPVITSEDNGFFYAGFDESLLLDQLEKLNQYIFTTLLIFWLIWMAIVLVLSRPMTQAIKNMTKAANSIAEGRDTIVSRDYFLTEFADLGESLDEMRVELRNRRDILIHAANYDPLSGVANRLKFSNTLHATITDLRPDGIFAVLLLDIDKFKKINDSYGHLFGDRLITYVAKLLKRRFGRTALVARVGGDEFALIMYGKSASFLRDRVDSLLLSHKQKVTLKGHTVSLRFSGGIAEFTNAESVNADQLMHRADVAMYASKIEGNAVTIYNEEALSEHSKKLQIISEVQSLDPEDATHGIYLDYQPKYDLHSGDLIGVEALCRWQNKRIGFLNPLEFVQYAEDHGAITKLTRIVVDMAFAQQAEWKRRCCDISVAINVSPTDILDERFIGFLSDKLNEYDIKSDRIELEVTEHDFIDDTALFNTKLSQLSSVGFRLSIDDFGSGYANLNGLRDYPFNCIKIDQQFIRCLESSDRDRDIVESVLKLAGQLKIDVIAEGIESKSELDLLVSLGCHYGQGFYFSKPVAPGKIEETCQLSFVND